MRSKVYLCIGKLLLLIPFWIQAQVLPTDFYDQKILSNLDFPTGIVFDGAGQGYIWQKKGVVRILRTDGALQTQPLIDIQEEVSNWKDHGLMGFALDRDFLTNGYFYLLYAVDLHHYYHYGTIDYHPDSTITLQATFGRVTRYQADISTAFTTLVPGSRKILLGETIGTGIPITWEFHGLGSIIAADDGTLLISCGDGSSSVGPDKGGDQYGTLASQAIQSGIMSPDQDLGSYRAQHKNNLNGKVLRIDPETGDGLPSNPYYDASAPRSPQSRIWAMGFRNPYRITVRPGTGNHYPQVGDPGDIYIGDVGNGGWEEISIADTGGLNFGWPLFEGLYWEWGFFLAGSPPHPDAPNPLYGENGCDQAYLTFKDLMALPTPNGEIFHPNPCNPLIAIPDSLPVWELQMPAIIWSNSQWNPPVRTEVMTFHELGHPTGLGLADSLSTIEGEIFGGFSSLAGVFYTADQYPEIYHGKYFGVDFSGWIKVFDFDENNQLKSVQPFHVFAKDIIHLALNPVNGSLYYINLDGHVRKISYGGNPPPVAVIQSDRDFGSGPLTVRFSAGSSTDDGPIAQYYWDFGDGNTSTESEPVHTYTSTDSSPAGYTVKLTVADTAGLSDTTEKIIGYNNSPPRVEISSIKNGDRFPPETSFVLDLKASVHDDESANENLTYEWRTYLQHNAHYHPDPPNFAPESYLLVNAIGCGGEDYWLRIELTVTDPQGLKGKSIRNIYPDCEEGQALQWLQLDAKTLTDKIQLTWRVDDPVGIDSFEIQRTSDFYHFQRIGTVRATQALPDISVFDDYNPVHGANIYRIKAWRRNRSLSFSNLVVADYPIIAPIKVYPNPAHEQFWIEFEKTTDAATGIELFDQNGIRRLRSSLASNPGQRPEFHINIAHMAKGLYFYRITNGPNAYVGKIVLF
jgi:PKD repeat protein/glucose/arabinose dehydrogenase